MDVVTTPWRRKRRKGEGWTRMVSRKWLNSFLDDVHLEQVFPPWIMWNRKPHPNPKPLEKLRIIVSGLFLPHDPPPLSSVCFSLQINHPFTSPTHTFSSVGQQHLGFHETHNFTEFPASFWVETLSFSSFILLAMCRAICLSAITPREPSVPVQSQIMQISWSRIHLYTVSRAYDVININHMTNPRS